MNNRDFENVEWVYDFIANSYLTVSEEAKKDLTYYHYLTPFSNTYYGLTNPVLLYCGHRAVDLSSKKVWTIRDGMLPLSIFFKEIIASSFSHELYIPAQFWFLVPNEWRPKVKYYTVKADTVFSKKNLPKKIFITGFCNSTMADAEEFKEDLEEIAKILGKDNIQKMEVMAYFPGKRNDIWGGWKEENILKYSRYLFENLKLDIAFPDFATINLESNFKDCLYVEINRNYFIQETYTKHFALARGAGLLDLPEVEHPLKKTTSTRLSLYHSMEIYELDEDRAASYEDPLYDKNFDVMKKILVASSKNHKVSAWWESWFATYVKHYYVSKQGKPNLKV